MMAYSLAPPLGAISMNSAIRLDFGPYQPPAVVPGTPWDNASIYSTNDRYAAVYDVFALNLKKGATYDFFSYSFFEPTIVLHDAAGRAVAVDNAGGYGMDYVFDFVAAYSGTYYLHAGWDTGLAPGHRYGDVSVYEDIDTIRKATVHYGTSKVDTARIGGARSDYSISTDGQHVTVRHALGTSGVDDEKYENIERFKFDDSWVATDIEGNAGQAYRLYKAAFDRAPDANGLGFWIKQLDSGAPFEAVAQVFVGSKEFGSLFGAQISDKAYVSALYENVLNRPLDQTGADYWLTALGNGASRAQILIDFSESTENQQAVIGSIQNGIHYDMWA
jgi:hypothetical protein